MASAMAQGGDRCNARPLSRLPLVWKMLPQRVGDADHLNDGVFDDSVAFDAGLEADGNVQRPRVFVVLHVIEEFADRLKATRNTGKLAVVETPPQG